MLPPDNVNGYVYPPVPINPSGAPNAAYAAPPRGMMGYGSSSGGLDTAVPTTPPGDPYATNPINAATAPGDTVSNFIPDPMQTLQMPIRDMYPDPVYPADFYVGPHGVGTDSLQRHSVEQWDSIGWTTPPGGEAGSANQWAPNPRFAEYPEGGNYPGFTEDTPGTVRPTARESQNTFYFTRPWDQQWARRLNGMHFSMADHRRNYPIMGVKPAPSWRNTSRVDPPPWDANIVDTPDGPANVLAPAIPVYDPPIGSQQYVFGG